MEKEGHREANWRKLVLGEMLARNARKYPNKLALVFENTRLTFADLNDRTASLRRTPPATSSAPSPCR